MLLKLSANPPSPAERMYSTVDSRKPNPIVGEEFHDEDPIGQDPPLADYLPPGCEAEFWIGRFSFAKDKAHQRSKRLKLNERFISVGIMQTFEITRGGRQLSFDLTPATSR